MDLQIDYADTAPGVSENETARGTKRMIQVVLGVVLIAAGFAMIFIPGPGIATLLVGLNLIKPDNALARWIRRKTPGVPNEGPIPRRHYVVGVGFLVVSSTVGVIYGQEAANWLRDLTGI
jgi:hypothetical protein